MIWLRYFVCVLWVPLLAVAGPIGLARLDRLIDQAGVIVVARVVQGSQSGASGSVVLEVQRTSKGSAGAGILTAEITTSNEFAATRDLKGLQGIWFLSNETNGAHHVLPAMVGSVPLDFSILQALTDLPPSWAPLASTTATAKVLRELAAALESKGEANVGLSAEFLSQIPAESASSLRALYRRMQMSSAATVSSAGLAGLLRSGDVESLATLKSNVGQLTDGQKGSSVAQAVCEYLNGNSRGLAVLAELAGTPQSIPRLRECAAYSLRNIHSRESVPFLLALLDSNNATVRYEAVAGLASYANSGFIPSESKLSIDGAIQPRPRSLLHTSETEDNFPTLETFLKNEAPVITFWRQWGKEKAGQTIP